MGHFAVYAVVATCYITPLMTSFIMISRQTHMTARIGRLTAKERNMNKNRLGFTLVEIMIVVAIIALLASIAVPNFMRARLRTQAGLVKDSLRIIDSAIDQYAIERNKANGTAVAWGDIKGYIKDSTPLYASAGKDILGNSLVTGLAVGTLPAVPAATKTALSDVTDAEFWSPYQ